MTIKDASVTGLLLDSLPKFTDPQLHQFMKSCGDWILGFGLVDEATSKRAVGLNKTFKCLASILIDQPFQPIHSFGNGCSRHEHQWFVISEEVFFDDNVCVRNFFGFEFAQALMIPPLIEIFAIKWAGDGFFALFAAALRADISPECRAIAL